jgi:putative oxidoreductase
MLDVKALPVQNPGHMRSGQGPARGSNMLQPLSARWAALGHPRIFTPGYSSAPRFIGQKRGAQALDVSQERVPFPGTHSKLIFPAILAADRFAHIGIPYPDLTGQFVGVVETVCGAVIIIVGLITRLAAIPLIIVVMVAIVSTKIPILLGDDFWISAVLCAAAWILRTEPESLAQWSSAMRVPKLEHYGWSMAHEARADFNMLLGTIYPLIVGAGAWSLDAMLVRSRDRQPG